MEVEHIGVATGDGVRTFTIDRPDRRNALSMAMRNGLAALLAEADADPDVAVIVLTAVDPVFSAGVDLKEAREQAAAGNTGRQAVNPGETIRATTKPVLSAVNGACVTGALEMALSCDLIVASDRARFADTHTSLGLLPGWGMSALLPRAVGVRMAKEMSATGRFVDADEALRIGLVNRVVPHEELAAAVQTLGVAMAASPPAAVAATFDLYDRGHGADLATALTFEEEAFTAWTPDLDASEARREARKGSGT